MFTARKIDKVPVRTYGWLNRREGQALRFEYRPWLVLPTRQLDLPPGTYVVGRGLFHPEVAREQGEELQSLLTLPPRYRTHEEEVSEVYGFAGVRDVGVRKCLTTIRELIGLGSGAPAAASQLT